jgi:hypothetical protein
MLEDGTRIPVKVLKDTLHMSRMKQMIESLLEAFDAIKYGKEEPEDLAPYLTNSSVKAPPLASLIIFRVSSVEPRTGMFFRRSALLRRTASMPPLRGGVSSSALAGANSVP